VDREALLSRYTSLELAVEDLKLFVARCREVLQRVKS
jgi:hypothetical protein